MHSLEFFIAVVDNVLDSAQISTILERFPAQNELWHLGQLEVSRTSKYVNHIHSDIDTMLYEASGRAVDRWHSQVKPKHFGLSASFGNTLVKLNKWEGGQLPVVWDRSRDLTPSITCILQLESARIGGEHVINQHRFNLKPGQALVFPSSPIVYQYDVTIVEQGQSVYSINFLS